MFGLESTTHTRSVLDLDLLQLNCDGERQQTTLVQVYRESNSGVMGSSAILQMLITFVL